MDILSDEILMATALEAFNIDDYWPESDVISETEHPGNIEKISIHNLYETLLTEMRFNVENEEEMIHSLEYLESKYKDTALSIKAEEDEIGDHGPFTSPDVVNFYDSNVCFAYLYKYAACYASMVHNALWPVFHVSPPTPVKRILSLKNHLLVVSLGGGSGNDLVGFCSALYGKHNGITKMNLTVIDGVTTWQKFFFKTWKLLKEQNFHNASAVLEDVDVQLYFLQANLILKEMWEKAIQIELKAADILLLVKVLSIIPGWKQAELLQNIAVNMKPGALLIFIDNPFPERAFAVVKQWLECIYHQEKQRYVFGIKNDSLGIPSLTSCYAHVRIYMRKLIYEEHH